MSPLLVLGTEMYALPTSRRMKVMRFDHTARVRRAISGIDSIEKRERRRYLKKKPLRAHTSLRQKYWMTRHAPFRAHRSPVLVLFPSFVSLFLLLLLLHSPFCVPCILRNAWISLTVLFTPSPNGATRKRLYHTAAKIFCQTFPSAT